LSVKSKSKNNKAKAVQEKLALAAPVDIAKTRRGKTTELGAKILKYFI
jgi:hypothetical protein